MTQPHIGKKVKVEVPSTTANLGPGFDCLGAALGLNNYFTILIIVIGNISSKSKEKSMKL